MEKKDRLEIFDLFRNVFVGHDFNVYSGINPCIIDYNNVRYNVYIKNLTPAQLSNNNPNVWRIQLPKRKAFEEIKDSNNIFLLLGYDYTRDVYATWNPYWAKQRLNVGESVSMYSRLSLQEEASKEQKIISYDLQKQGKVIVFPRLKLLEYLSSIKAYFPVETKYTAIGSSLRKKQPDTNIGRNSAKSLKMNKKPNITKKEIVELIAPHMCKEPPEIMVSLQLLNEYFGNQYAESMKLNDWMKLLKETDWYKLSGNVNPAQQAKEINSNRKLLKVTLQDGTVVCRTKAVDTFVDVINSLYPDLVQELNLIQNNFPLIKKDSNGDTYRKLNGGYFVNVHSNTERKKYLLERIALLMDEFIQVEIIEPVVKEDTQKYKKPTEPKNNGGIAKEPLSKTKSISSSSKIESESIANNCLKKAHTQLLIIDKKARVPYEVMKYLEKNDNACYSKLLLKLSKGSVTLSGDKFDCLLFDDPNNAIPRLFLSVKNWSLLLNQKDRSRWCSDHKFNILGIEYYISNQLHGHDVENKSNLRVNDFAILLYQYSDRKYFLNFEKKGEDSHSGSYNHVLYKTIRVEKATAPTEPPVHPFLSIPTDKEPKNKRKEPVVKKNEVASKKIFDNRFRIVARDKGYFIRRLEDNYMYFVRPMFPSFKAKGAVYIKKMHQYNNTSFYIVHVCDEVEKVVGTTYLNGDYICVVYVEDGVRIVKKMAIEAP